MPGNTPAWKKTAQEKIESRDNSIPPEWRLGPGQVQDDQLNVLNIPHECGIMTNRELKITETDSVELVQKLMAREYTSREVTLAFCKRAAIAQQVVNCLSEIFFEKALHAAGLLDVEYSATGVPRGSLHGLPVSLKDCFKIEGTDATIGYTSFANERTAEYEESEITKIMRKSGAILFCKTNVPTGMMAGETSNAVYGYTVNPYNRTLSSGGSSGGESALLAMKGSPLGVGTDVGGSIRIPASFCCLYSLKPSFGRFPAFGLRDGMNGQEAVRSTVGPMASSLAGVEMWCRAVLRSQPWMSADPDCLPLPYRDMEVPKKLCFGILPDDGIVRPLPPVERALLLTKTALEAVGHTVIHFNIDDPLYADSLKFAMYRSAAADTVDRTLAKTQEPWPQGLEMLEAIVSRTKKGGTCGHDAATVYDLWEAQVKRTKYAKSVLQAWAETKTSTGTGREIDALLMPCTPWPASEKYGFSYDNYTSLWNVLDYCAVTVPVTQVSLVDDMKPQHEARNETEADIWQNYLPEIFRSAPVAIQLVGRRLNEEYLLGVARRLDEAIWTVRNKRTNDQP